MKTQHNNLKQETPPVKRLCTVYKHSMKPNRMYMVLLRTKYVYYVNNDGTFAARNARHCIENPAKFVDERAKTTPCITNIIDGHWISEDKIAISDNVHVLTFCTMTGTSMHPVKGIICTDPKLEICSIDSAGIMHFYEKNEVCDFPIRKLDYSTIAQNYVYSDALTESHTLEEFQQICKMLEMPFPCLI